jgi:hypothetical protein
LALDHTFAKLRIFALEVALGLAVGAVGLMQLVYGVPPWISDPEMLRKFATSLITIGGTLVASGFFRFFFSMRLDATERSILDRLDGVTDSIGATIARMLPAGVANRPSDCASASAIDPATARSAPIRALLLTHDALH